MKNTCSSTHLFGPFRDGFQPFPFRRAYKLTVCRKSWFLLNWIPFIKVFGNVILMEIFGFIYFLPNVMHLYPEYLKGLTVSYLPSLSDSLISQIMWLTWLGILKDNSKLNCLGTLKGTVKKQCFCLHTYLFILMSCNMALSSRPRKRFYLFNFFLVWIITQLFCLFSFICVVELLIHRYVLFV